jgi:hypothetical protein
MSCELKKKTSLSDGLDEESWEKVGRIQTSVGEIVSHGRDFYFRAHSWSASGQDSSQSNAGHLVVDENVEHLPQ